MHGGEYVLFQDYQTMPEQLILARILNRCAHVFDELNDIRRRAVAEHWAPFLIGFAECCISRNVVCSLDLAGLTGRRHQNVVRAIERRVERKRGRSAIYPTKSRYVAPTGLVLDFMKGDVAKYAYAELQDALVSCGVLWFKPDPWTPGKQWPQYDFKAFRWPGWATDYIASLPAYEPF